MSFNSTQARSQNVRSRATLGRCHQLDRALGRGAYGVAVVGQLRRQKVHHRVCDDHLQRTRVPLQVEGVLSSRETRDDTEQYLSRRRGPFFCHFANLEHNGHATAHPKMRETKAHTRNVFQPKRRHKNKTLSPHPAAATPSPRARRSRCTLRFQFHGCGAGRLGCCPRRRLLDRKNVTRAGAIKDRGIR